MNLAVAELSLEPQVRLHAGKQVVRYEDGIF